MLHQTFNSKTAITPVFSLPEEVARFYETHPDIAYAVTFIDAESGNVVHPDPVKAQEMNACLRDNADCRTRIPEAINFCRREKTSEVLHSPFRAFVILYTGEDQIRLLGKKTPVDTENFFNFDHETAHVAIFDATSRGRAPQIVMESIADVNAMLRHFQRAGTETGMAEKLFLTRIVKSLFYADQEPAGHFTAPAIEHLLSIKDKISVKDMSSAEIETLASRIGIDHTPNPVHARILHECVFAPIIDAAKHKTGVEIATLLADMTLETKNPMHFKWLSLALTAFMDEKFSIKGKHMNALLREAGRDPENLRLRLRVRRMETHRHGDMFGIRAATPKIHRPGYTS